MFSSSTKFIDLAKSHINGIEVHLVSTDDTYLVSCIKGKIYDEESQACYIFDHGQWDVSPYSKRRNNINKEFAYEMVRKLNSQREMA